MVASNYVFTIIFFLELAMKMIALPTRDFCCDGFILLDCFIVTVALVEMVLETGES